MKTYQNLLFFILAFAMLLSGCEMDADNVVPYETPSKLVVLSFISPQDTVLKVQLQKSQPALGKWLDQEQRKVSNANVTITDGTRTVKLKYDANTDAYLTNPHEWYVEAGKTYTLQVTASSSSAIASCTIPQATGVAITDVSSTYSVEPDYYGGGEVRKYKIAYKWNDAPSADNYYRTLAAREYYFKDYQGEVRSQVEPLYLDHGLPGLYKDDKAQSGTLASDDFYYYQRLSDEVEKKYKLHLLLVVCDKNYYLYFDALHKQEQTKGNPFAEPVVLYSNIAGGLGVFAGYNQVEAVKEME